MENISYFSDYLLYYDIVLDLLIRSNKQAMVLAPAKAHQSHVFFLIAHFSDVDNIIFFQIFNPDSLKKQRPNPLGERVETGPNK
jgi:hypothetical protein